MITLTGILVLYFSRYAYVLEAAAAMLSIMGIVELLRAAKCCTWYNVLLLSLIAAAVCMRRLPYYTEILLFVWVLAIVAFALFMSRMKEVRSIGFWHILPCALMLPIFFYSAVEIRRISSAERWALTSWRPLSVPERRWKAGWAAWSAPSFS